MKIISGGQNGVDQAALATAKAFDLATGGWMPSGWKTLDGPRPEFRALYGMRQMGGGYRVRTWANVRDSDATLTIAADYGSPGERCTTNAINDFGKDRYAVFVVEGAILLNPKIIIAWLRRGNITVLNVAGNSEQTAPGIFRVASAFLARVFLGLGCDPS